MIARVVVNHNSKSVDKFYDYIIPPHEENNVFVGSRVIVPFGRGNRQREAYVFRITEGSGAANLKSIASVVEGGPVFDEKMLKVISWMREKYLCTYSEIMHAVIPAGISVKPEEWIVIENSDMAQKSEVRKKIISVLEDNGGGCEINYLMQFFESNIRTTLNKMCDDGILGREYRDNNYIKDKKIRIASLAVSYEDASEAIENLGRSHSHVQEKMLEILSMNEFVSVADLVRFTNGSYNAVNALEKKGYISLKNITVDRNYIRQDVRELTKSPELTDEQKNAVSIIKKHTDKNEYAGVLLHGVTGSGKTEVFMNIIAEVIEKGRQAILLVPEISLTPQMVSRFVNRFGNRVAVFHSGLSLGEKYDEWKKMRDKRADIVIGARSAVFAPFSDVGVIIMDEEHEQTYKSEMPPRYNTREVARFRAEMDGAVFVMASATPSVESYYKAGIGEYELIEMKKRATNAKMPEVFTVDMRAELEDGNKSIFSRKLIEEIEKNLKNKEQTILFLNRRGFSTFVSCRSCGFTAKCPSCSISLTYHKFSDTLKCHYCGYTHKNYTVCPTCGSKYIRYFGGGTQKVEEEIKKLFPEASTIRMDVDTTGRKFAHEKILNDFEKNNIDILIGTQMVAKGLDFENVTLVGVVSADVMLNLDDYRSGEKSYSVLEQVSGRAGRAQKPGRAIIQTYTPKHVSVISAKEHDYAGFYNAEIATRKAMWYPPFCDMVLIGFSSVSESLVSQTAKYFAKYLDTLSKLPQKVQVLGPVPSGISKIKNKHRWQIVIKCENADGLNVILNEARDACMKNDCYKNVTVTIDKNPNGIL